MITTVLLADNATSGRINRESLRLDKAATLVVCDPADLTGFAPAVRVRVADRTLHMPLRKYKAIQDELARCHALLGGGLTDEALAEFAAALTSRVEGRLQDALHSGEAPALLTATVLGELAEIAPHARNCHLGSATLLALSERVLVDLPERIRTYRHAATAAR